MPDGGSRISSSLGLIAMIIVYDRSDSSDRELKLSQMDLETNLRILNKTLG